MKWLLSIFLGLVSLTILGLDFNKSVLTPHSLPSTLEVVHDHSTDLNDLNDGSPRRGRTVSSSNTRSKSDRLLDRFIFQKIIFSDCRIWQSYSPDAFVQSVGLFIGKSIHVNAP